MAKLCSIGLICGGFLLSFLALHLVHVLFLPVRVVLYDAFLDACVAAVVVGAAVMVLRRRLATTPMETALSAAVGFLLAVIFCITVPTIIDRSLSIYILEKLVQRGGSIREAAFGDIVKQEFMQEHRVIDIRLTEQVNSGTVVIENGCVRLTRWGEMIAHATRFYRTHFLPKERDIMGRYTDDLTDPFRRSAVLVPYKCE